jgi:hypothetical protein
MSFEARGVGVRIRWRSVQGADCHRVALLLLGAALIGHAWSQTASTSSGGGAGQGVSSVGGSGGVIPTRRATIDRERGPVPITPP